ncbi:MAG: GTPase HflX [Chloroflexota bacterium]|nr:GTPase HflX [Chloroflexota bacterium]MDE3193676.1 GTPase HflX [Chloroflexota bacterium]
MTIDTAAPAERAFLVALDTGARGFDVDDSLDELATLVEAAGGRVVGRAEQRRRAPDPSTYVGKGKATELVVEARRVAADLLVCDDELTPQQQRDLEELAKMRVVDRSAVILDIFAKHAQSKEGRIQVEVAQLEYVRPRLRGMWRHLERTGGGVGTRGPGETQLESDRRVIERRLADLRQRLHEVERQRERSRRSRSQDGLFLAALVGYTNAGKSTLLNALSGADVLVADQPFATLDPTTRRVELPNGTVILLSDTVGFINKLPPTLIAAFHATLEELSDADLLVHVVDAPHPDLHERMTVVDATLADLGLSDRPRLVVLNKADALRGTQGSALREALSSEMPTAVWTSATTGEGMGELRERLAHAARAGWLVVRLRLPHSSGALVQRIRERGSLRRADYTEAGIEIEAEVPASFAAELQRFSVGPTGRRAPEADRTG